MIVHENRLLADDSHVISYLTFVENWEKCQKTSVAVVIGTLRVKTCKDKLDSHVISYLIFVENWEKCRKICRLLQ